MLSVFDRPVPLERQDTVEPVRPQANNWYNQVQNHLLVYEVMFHFRLCAVINNMDNND